MAQFIKAISAADDAAAFPLSKLQSVTCKADQAVVLTFSPGSLGEGQAASVDLITLAITADKESVVIDAICNALAEDIKGRGIFTVCDDVNSVFAHPDILSCTITKDAA
jgi:hypothetical protein